MTGICTDCCVRDAEIEFLRNKIIFYENLVKKIVQDRKEETLKRSVVLTNSINKYKKLDVDGSGELL